MHGPAPHAVMRLADLCKLYDTSGIQPYTINNHRVAFLQPRPQVPKWVAVPSYSSTHAREVTLVGPRNCSKHSPDVGLEAIAGSALFPRPAVCISLLLSRTAPELCAKTHALHVVNVGTCTGSRP